MRNPVFLPLAPRIEANNTVTRHNLRVSRHIRIPQSDETRKAMHEAGPARNEFASDGMAFAGTLPRFAQGICS